LLTTKNRTFPLWDILFGTFRLPENRLPDNYGRQNNNPEFWL
jgi:sterol desaturase/sphingolipid hydroxylase (fatty acid hydroxylase superfamily)